MVFVWGFLGWLWLLSVDPTATAALFTFLIPLFAILLGVVIYGESVTPALIVAFVLVATGIILNNRRARAGRGPLPDKQADFLGKCAKFT